MSRVYFLGIFKLTVLLAIAGYLLFDGSTLLQQNDLIEPQTKTNGQSQVLSAQTVRFNETIGSPSPNSIFFKVNAERVKTGLEPLKPNTELASVAEKRALDMKSRKYYAHKNPDGYYYYDFLIGTSFDNSVYSCENLNLQFTIDPDKYVNDWLNSPKHKECMYDKRITDAGYAVIDVTGLSDEQKSFIVVAIHATK